MRLAAVRGSATNDSAPTPPIVPAPLTPETEGRNIQHMMTSSSGELLRRGVEPVISIDHLRVIRGKRPAIRDLSVQIARGTITGLLGPSGCGKTTLMRSIVG